MHQGDRGIRIRCWADLKAFWKNYGGATAAETKLIDHCKAGTPCTLGDGTRPDLPEKGKAPDPSRHIRAEVLRYLIVGGCSDCAVDGIGVQLKGACVTEQLDLSMATAWGQSYLVQCAFSEQIYALQARLTLINLGGSLLAQGLDLQGAEIAGPVFLRNGFSAKGVVSLSGAKIGGSLVCEGGTFENKGGVAINAQRMTVAESFFFRSVTVKDGWLNLTSAHVGDLVDDMDSWPGGEQVILDGFTYDRLAGHATPTDARRRLEWLAKGDTWNGTFFPQPYTQLAKVLSEMGHEADARAVRVAQGRKLRAFMRRERRVVPNGDVIVGLRSLWADITHPLLWLWHFLSELIVGYGYKPWRSVYALAVLTLLTGGIAQSAWWEGDMAPNSDVILTSAAWQEIEATQERPAIYWSGANCPADSDTPCPGKDWESFYAGAYALDVVVPIIDLGQTEAWAPSTNRGPWGYGLWWGQWLLSIAGWIVTALGAAAITGVIRREGP